MCDTPIIGHIQIHFPELDSSNQYALDLISKSKPQHGTVISTSFQRQGRGQIGRDWFSPANKNITLSIILKPDFLHIKDQFYLNMAFALAVRESISEKLGKEVKIKWPNDIYVEDKKIAGILIQNVLQGSTYSYAVLGIGINVNQRQFNPKIPNPTSMQIVKDKEFSLKEIKANLFAKTDAYLAKLQNLELDSLKAEYVPHLYRLGEVAQFEIDQEKQEATIIGIERDGQVVLKFSDDSTRSFNLNEIKYII